MQDIVDDSDMIQEYDNYTTQEDCEANGSAEGAMEMVYVWKKLEAIVPK